MFAGFLRPGSGTEQLLPVPTLRRLRRTEETRAMPREENDHAKIAAAGWGHRKNHHGFVIYLNPQTGWWHTRLEALAILDNKLVSIAGKETPVDQPRSV